MNKSELVGKIRERFDYTWKEANGVVDAVLETVTESLRNDEVVSLTGWGTFKPINRPARSVRNPQTGGMIDVASKRVVRFKAGRGLSQDLNA